MGRAGCVLKELKHGILFVRMLLGNALNRCAVQPFTDSDETRCCVNTIYPSEDGHVNARNMSRIVV